MQIAGHTFLVTGGASGLGAATARKLAAAGGNLDIVARAVPQRLADAFGRQFVVENRPGPARAAWWARSTWRSPRPKQ